VRECGQKKERKKVVTNTEIEIKQELKTEKYKPLTKFSGWNECFNVSCEKNLIDLIIRKIKQNEQKNLRQ